MILAELKSKVPHVVSRWEDPLTSNVFGSFKYMDRQFGLKTFLGLSGVLHEFKSRELREAKITLWETRESKDGRIRREPDVIIETRQTTIFVEAKYRARLDKDQLKDEYRIGSQYPNFYLVCVTDGFSEPRELKEVRRELRIPKSRLVWVSWQQIEEKLERRLDRLSEESGIDNHSRECAKDVVELLKKKGLARFSGFEKAGVLEKDLKVMYETTKKFTNQIFKFSKELEYMLEDDRIVRAYYGENIIEKNGTGKSDDFGRWFVTEIGPYYRDEKWVHYTKNECLAALWVWFDIERPEASVGCTFRFTKQTKMKLMDNFKEVPRLVGGSPHFEFDSDSQRYPCTPRKVRDLGGTFFDGSEMRRARWLNIYKYHSIDGRRLIGKARKDLVRFRDMAEKLGLVPTQAYLKQS